MEENYLSKIILDAAFSIHREMGPGLFESVYEALLCYELENRGLAVVRQQLVPIHYKGMTISTGFKADLIVAEKVIVELKSVEELAPVHHKQLLTYLRLKDLKLGLLLNFNEVLLKNGIRRVVNNL